MKVRFYVGRPAKGPLFLLLAEGSACGLRTVAGSAALDVHMLCAALIIFVVNTLHSFAVNGDGRGRMGK